MTESLALEQIIEIEKLIANDQLRVKKSRSGVILAVCVKPEAVPVLESIGVNVAPLNARVQDVMGFAENQPHTVVVEFSRSYENETDPRTDLASKLGGTDALKAALKTALSVPEKQTVPGTPGNLR